MHHYKYYLLLCFQKLIDKIKNERDVENEKIIEKIMEDSIVETLYQGFNYLLDVPGDQDGSKVVYYEDLMKAVFPCGILSLGEKRFSYSSSKKSKSNQKPVVYNVLEMVDRNDEENEFHLNIDASRDPTSLSDNNSEIIATNIQTDDPSSSKNLDERQENDISNVSDDIFHINLY
jgi:hypothetical protein